MSLKYINRYKQVAENFDILFICGFSTSELIRETVKKNPTPRYDVQDKQINLCFMGGDSTLQKEKKQYGKRRSTTAELEQEERKLHITEHHGESLIILCFHVYRVPAICLLSSLSN